MTLAELCIKLVLATLLGGIVGLERERRDRPAGLRTHMLVCMGSALITMVSMLLAPSGDPARIAAQIVSGIGFLGAGTIFRSGNAVRGLTTAAGLWAVAGIGMGVAAGGTLLVLAVLTAFLVFGINTWLRAAEDRLGRTTHDMLLATARGHDAMSRVFEALAARGVQVVRVRWVSVRDDPEAVVELSLRVPAEEAVSSLTAWVSEQEGVRRVEWL